MPMPLQERHLPGLEVAIVLNFTAPHRIARIVALQHHHHIQEAFGARDFMVIRLTPIGAQLLLGTPMNLLTDRTLALDDLDSRFSRLLTEHAESARDWAARFDIVESILAERLACAPSPPAGLLRAWQLLQQSPNQIDLARLTDDFGCSRRHLIAQFHKYFGMTPKSISRIRRFQLAIAAVHRSHVEGKPYLDTQPAATPTAIRWTELALQCGYYDQAHLINEFRAFSGLSPVEFLRRTLHE